MVVKKLNGPTWGSGHNKTGPTGTIWMARKQVRQLRDPKLNQAQLKKRISEKILIDILLYNYTHYMGIIQ